MIAGVLHAGSGLGDQIHRYITVRSLAELNGWEWGMLTPHNFKGSEFMQLEMGVPINSWLMHTYEEKEVRDTQGIDIRSFDPEFAFIQDNTVIDGSFEDFKYWGHNLNSINDWLKVEPIEIPDDLCIINFRGGEYATDPNLFLGKDYYELAIAKMRAINPHMLFEVHTDDPVLARTLFPEFMVIDTKPITHSQHTEMGLNWRALRYARYAIISNSAFAIIPRNLKHHESEAVTLSPRYWARRAMKVWARPACYYSEFLYV